jgi:hypothetical protein
MTASAKAHKKWARQRFQRTAQQCKSMMEPHLDKMESENGMLAMVMVSGFAACVHAGTEPPEALTITIKMAAQMSGIPEVALEAHARLSSEMLKCYEFDQRQNNSPR